MVGGVYLRERSQKVRIFTTTPLPSYSIMVTTRSGVVLKEVSNALPPRAKKQKTTKKATFQSSPVTSSTNIKSVDVGVGPEVSFVSKEYEIEALSIIEATFAEDITCPICCNDRVNR